MAVYIHSIVGKQHPVRLDGLHGIGSPPSRLRTVTAGPLCAVVSDAPDGLRPEASDVAAHQRIQDRLLADGTVLPMRLGMTAPGDDTVRLGLEEHAQDYMDRLQELEGCAEYQLKVSHDVSADERAVGAVHARQEALAAGVVEAFVPFARRQNRAEPTGDDILDVSFLIAHDKEELFLTTELSLAHQMGDDFEFRLEGPLPPYTFA
ncbi:GvpL/GvpF family gas vesicle protein [Streptomyces sp. NPDC002004]